MESFKKFKEEFKNNIENRQKQYSASIEMSSKEKQEEFNDRMVKATRKYQQIYDFEISNKKGHEYWNNEADAFKHTFGSALMVFEMGEFSSALAGAGHESNLPNNPKDEKNMDYWNNNQGREIAKEIKKEYGELNFIKLPKEKQEDIIAHKVMVRMKNGDLITKPDDDRKYDYRKEWVAERAYDLLKKLKASKANQVQPQQIKKKKQTVQTGALKTTKLF